MYLSCSINSSLYLYYPNICRGVGLVIYFLIGNNSVVCNVAEDRLVSVFGGILSGLPLYIS